MPARLVCTTHRTALRYWHDPPCYWYLLRQVWIITHQSPRARTRELGKAWGYSTLVASSSDPRAALLAPFQIAFSVTISLLGFYVNGNQVYSFDKQQPAGLFLGLFEAWGYVFSAFSAYPYNWIIRMGKQGPKLGYAVWCSLLLSAGSYVCGFYQKGEEQPGPCSFQSRRSSGLGEGYSRARTVAFLLIFSQDQSL